jgi:predicted ferric reductase
MDSRSHQWPTVAILVILAVAIAPLLAELPGAPLTFRHGGDWLGWLGAGLLSGSLLLMMREPRIVLWFGGMERMYRWHHALGVWACAVLVAHPIVLAAAVMPTSATRAWSLVSPVRWFPANALGWAALLGLTAGLVATLLWHLPYAAWRRLHFCLSVAVLLGLAHVFTYRGLTPSLVLAAGPSILALSWRLVRTNRGLGAHPYEVESLSRIAVATTEVVLRPLAGPLRVAPGQFVMVAFFSGPRYQGCGEFHPYTVCDARNDGSLVLAIKALGDCTTKIQSLQKGVAARVEGPYGKFLAAASLAPSLWIAGGIGVTPFIARLRAKNIKAPTRLIYACRDADAAYADELKSFADREPLFELRTIVVQDDLAALFPLLDEVGDLRSRGVHISGPPPFVRTVIAELQVRGVPRPNIHVEEFAFTSA